MIKALIEHYNEKHLEKIKREKRRQSK